VTSVILALDSAVEGASAAVLDRGVILAHVTDSRPRAQAEILVTLADQAMKDAGADYPALAAVAVTTGPGSFTGIRIALAAGKGFALAAGCPVTGITTLEALAFDVPGLCLAAIDAAKGEVYVQLFHDGQAAGGPLALPPAEAAALSRGQGGLTIAGTARALLAPCLATAPHWRDGPPDTRHVARIAQNRIAQGRIAPGPVQPLYVRRPDAVPAPQRGGLA